MLIFSHNGGRERKFCDMTCNFTHRQSTWQQHSSLKYRPLAENQLITSLFTVPLVAKCKVSTLVLTSRWLSTRSQYS